MNRRRFLKLLGGLGAAGAFGGLVGRGIPLKPDGVEPLPAAVPTPEPVPPDYLEAFEASVDAPFVVWYVRYEPIDPTDYSWARA